MPNPLVKFTIDQPARIDLNGEPLSAEVRELRSRPGTYAIFIGDGWTQLSSPVSSKVEADAQWKNGFVLSHSEHTARRSDILRELETAGMVRLEGWRPWWLGFMKEFLRLVLPSAPKRE